jgi:hypothetical protein
MAVMSNENWFDRAAPPSQTFLLLCYEAAAIRSLATVSAAGELHLVLVVILMTMKSTTAASW